MLFVCIIQREKSNDFNKLFSWIHLQITFNKSFVEKKKFTLDFGHLCNKIKIIYPSFQTKLIIHLAQGTWVVKMINSSCKQKSLNLSYFPKILLKVIYALLGGAKLEEFSIWR